MKNGKYAIVSVYDKEGIIEFCKELNFLGYDIISTSGTYKFLKENGIRSIEVSSITNFPEILDGRVKTLHPLIHGGILYRESYHKDEISYYGIPNIDIVVVNLYPFEKTVLETNDIEKIVENIDIGGPTLLRAAAKNFERVIAIVDKNDYTFVLETLKSGNNTLEFRLNLATKVFNYIANYDAIISSFFNRYTSTKFPSETAIPLRKFSDLRYGENPHQSASLYVIPLIDSEGLGKINVLGGKELSYNNILDIDVSIDILRNFANKNFCCIIKHNNPSGAGVGDTLLDAYVKALNCDSISAFGGIVGFSQKVSKVVAEEIVKNFYEVIIAPDYEDSAVEILRTKKNLRIVKVNLLPTCQESFDIRGVNGGLLLQDKDLSSEDIVNCQVVSNRKPEGKEIEDLQFAWDIVKFVKSNAIVLVKDKSTVGICGGQTSRVDAVKIAIQRAKERGFSLEGAVCASDGFFPFGDSVRLLASEGIKAIVQPGGSLRDNESIEEANKNNIAMVFTGKRHFKH